ncbi:MAG: 3'-5' exonuclease [Candidatus Omnitrophota bacterium]|jgi:DNA polymerase-3 subunit alpha (Gram-positive type)
MSKDIDEIEFTIFDTETTGLDPKSGDRIIELAAVRFKGENRIAEFQSLVNSGYPVSLGAFSVNKISVDMLVAAPKPQEAIPKFLDFVQGSCLCCYNADFDLGFLNNELKILGLVQIRDIPVVDVLKIARMVLPGLERYALWFVAENLGIKVKQEHRALSDVELTLGVFYRLKEIIKVKGIVDFDKFLELSY